MTGGPGNPMPFVERLAYGLISDVGAILRFISLPCASDPMLYVEAAVPALLKAFWEIASPDPKEVYHKVWGQSFVCSLKQTMVEAREFAGQEPAFYERALFSIAEIVDMAIWYLFLADVGEDALINWGSQIIQLSGCFDHTHKIKSGPMWLGGIYDATGPWAISCSVVDGSDIVPMAVTIPPGRSGFVGGAFQYNTFANPFPQAVESRVIAYDPFDQAYHYQLDYTRSPVRKNGQIGKAIAFQKFKNGTGRTIVLEHQSRGLEEQPYPYHEYFNYAGIGHVGLIG
jgi:hypothetical protein